MPWSNDGGGPKSSGPWGGGQKNNGGNPWGGGGGGGSGGGGGQGPNIDDFFKKGERQLRSIFGDGGGFGVLLVMLIAAGAWIYASVFTVQQNERALILTFGKFSQEVGPGLNFAPWPVQAAIIHPVTTNNTVAVGGATSASSNFPGSDDGLMLTGDENIVDINFQVVWVISDLQKYVFNLADPNATIRAVAESAMREIVGRSQLAPLLNEQRGQLAAEVTELIQRILDDYDSGVRIVRVTLDRADPPPQVIDSFRAVQAAEQERDRILKEADKYYNEETAKARGTAQREIEDARGYSAQQIAAARGDAARFNAVLEAYLTAPEVTRKRLYIEMMERVLQGAPKVFIDGDDSGSGVVPFLPLDRLGQPTSAASSAAAARQ